LGDSEELLARGYSEDLRVRLVGIVESGRSARSTAKLFLVSASSAVKWAQRWRREKSVAPSKLRGHRRSPLDVHAAWLLKLIEEKVDLTLEEICPKLAKRGVRVAVSTLWNFYDRHKISFKKNRVASEQDRPDVAAARTLWKAGQGRLTPPTSIRSSRPSPRSRRICEKPKSDQYRHSGIASEQSLTDSQTPSAKTSSVMPVMHNLKQKML
jgi:transposase